MAALPAVHFKFLSTPSARRATPLPCAVAGRPVISIHALREEGDSRACCSVIGVISFLSTPSARRATMILRFVSRSAAISIHALREEGDTSGRTSTTASTNFYPRPPRGGRLCTLPKAATHGTFLSTPSARRATQPRPTTPAAVGNFYPRPPRGGRHPTTSYMFSCLQVISIHALREEGDQRKSYLSLSNQIFLSTPSARRATAKTEKNISAFVSL